jgi:hypothetical protein
MSLRGLGLITEETMREHRATWWVYAGRERIRHTHHMRGTWGYDVTCSCGRWESHTGGATRGTVQRALDDHRLEAQWLAERVATGRHVTAIRGRHAGQHGIETVAPDEYPGPARVSVILWDGADDEEGYSVSDLRYEEAPTP